MTAAFVDEKTDHFTRPLSAAGNDDLDVAWRIARQMEIELEHGYPSAGCLRRELNNRAQQLIEVLGECDPEADRARQVFSAIDRMEKLLAARRDFPASMLANFQLFASDPDEGWSQAESSLVRQVSRLVRALRRRLHWLQSPRHEPVDADMSEVKRN